MVKMRNMADWEKVSVGAMVSGTDKFGESFEGEVLAFDIQYRLVVISILSAVETL